MKVSLLITIVSFFLCGCQSALKKSPPQASTEEQGPTSKLNELLRKKSGANPSAGTRQRPVNLDDTMNNLVDLGRDDGVLRCNLFKEHGLDCLMHRFTGVDVVDWNYGPREIIAKNNRILWGAYGYATTQEHKNQSPEEQADRFLRHVAAVAYVNNSEHVPILLALDTEGKFRMNLSESARFLKRVYDVTGAYPGYYVNHSELIEDSIQITADNWNPSDGHFLSNCWLWPSRYSKLKTLSLRIPDLWDDWTAFQYCGDNQEDEIVNGKLKKTTYFYTALKTKSDGTDTVDYSGKLPVFIRDTPPQVIHKDTNRVERQIIDRSLYNGSPREWQSFVQRHTRTVAQWNQEMLKKLGFAKEVALYRKWLLKQKNTIASN